MKDRVGAAKGAADGTRQPSIVTATRWRRSPRGAPWVPPPLAGERERERECKRDSSCRAALAAAGSGCGARCGGRAGRE